MARLYDSAAATAATQTPIRTTFICDLLAPTPRKFTNYPSGIAVPSVVGAVSLTSGGSGYTSVPTVTVSGGGGQGAIVVAVLTAGVVSALVLVCRGWGYTSNPSVAFSGGGGTGAAATASIGTTFAFAPAAFTPVAESADGTVAVLGQLKFVDSDNAFTDLVTNSANAGARVTVQRVWRNSADSSIGTEIWLEGYTGKPYFEDEYVVIDCGADVGRRGSSPRALWTEVMQTHLPPAQGTKIPGFKTL